MIIYVSVDPQNLRLVAEKHGLFVIKSSFFNDLQSVQIGIRNSLKVMPMCIALDPPSIGLVAGNLPLFAENVVGR